MPDPEKNYVNQEVSLHFNHRSETQCRCRTRGLNYCDGGVIRAELMVIVEFVRKLYCKRAQKDVEFRVLSGVRCQRYNALIYGEQGQTLPTQIGTHTEGKAIDLSTPPGFSLYEFWKDFSEVNPFGGLGLYLKWKNYRGIHTGGIHVDIRETEPGRRWHQTESGLVLMQPPTDAILESAKRLKVTIV